MLPAAIACVSFFEILEDRIGLGNLLLWFGFEDFAEPKAQPIEHARHGAGSREVFLCEALRAERRNRGLGRQPRIGQGRPKRGILLRLRLGECT